MTSALLFFVLYAPLAWAHASTNTLHPAAGDFPFILPPEDAVEPSIQSNDFREVKVEAEKGDAEAQYTVGKSCELGEVVPRDYAEAIKWYRKAANQGNKYAETALGDLYAKGQGVTQDYIEAYKWYDLAAALGDTNAASKRSKVGFFMNPDQIAKAQQLALNAWKTPADSIYTLIMPSAEKGDAIAEGIVGDYYERGEVVPLNDAEAVKWYRKAADQGDAEAQYDLGTYYEFNNISALGGGQDYADAIKWFRLAANQGKCEAQLSLADCYNETQDYVEAAKWYREAADQGDDRAQYKLGVYYADGKGVSQNDVEAYVWLSIAAIQGRILDYGPSGGPVYAAQVRDVLAQRMSREEIVEGQHEAAVFVPHSKRSDSSSNSSNSTKGPTATGTGFFITDDGYLISNYHVVKDAATVRLVTSGGLIPARVIQVDQADDLALLKADGNFSSLPIAASRDVSLGATVATIGFPDPGLQGFAPKLAKGEIAALSGAADDPRYFQISVPVQPGNSGGALVDENGNVIGIVSAKLDAATALAASGALPEDVNYAIKSSFVLSFLESVPGTEAKLKRPNLADEKFEDVVKQAQAASAMVVVY
jgi:TPR repeat protein